MLLCILDTETTCSFSLWMAELTSPHNVHVLLFETCECIILYGKKNFDDVVKDFKQENYPR